MVNKNTPSVYAQIPESKGKNKQGNQLKKKSWGFPGGSVVKNLPVNAEDMGSIPGLGRLHMPRSHEAWGNNINVENPIKLFTDKIVTIPNYALELTLMAQSYVYNTKKDYVRKKFT